jgi:hypothetical protein
MRIDVHRGHFGADWRRFRHTLAARNLRFAGLFAPEGAESANFFLVPRVLLGFPGNFDDFGRTTVQRSPRRIVAMSTL